MLLRKMAATVAIVCLSIALLPSCDDSPATPPPDDGNAYHQDQVIIFSSRLDFDVGSNPRSICSHDFDGDGDIDLATANAASTKVSVLLNRGNGTFTTDLKYGVGMYPRSLCSADLDGDGDIDLGVANSSSDDVTILINITGD